MLLFSKVILFECCFENKNHEHFEEYTTSVTVFINKCIDDVVPTVTSTYSNQKLWITGNIRTELKGRAAAFKEQDSNPEAYKKSCNALQRTIKQAKRQYRTNIESYYTSSSNVAGLANYYRLQREAL
jgi:hypothetical protein